MAQSKLKTTVITNDNMNDAGKQNTINWYQHGGLALFLDLYETTGTLEKHNEALNDKPVMNWIATYQAEQAIDLETMEIVFIDEEIDSNEIRMPITATIKHRETGETVYHTLMSTSFVFRLNEDKSVTSLYLD